MHMITQVKEMDLPRNDPNIERLKMLNEKYFKGKGEFFQGFSRVCEGLVGQECGIELRATITRQLPCMKPEEYTYSFYEFDTPEETANEIELMKMQIE